jgi:UDP-N-acetyl-D-galactosamine dehydrogenase
MGGYVARELMGEMARRGTSAKGARILVMGLAFKENCPDLRNTRVIDIVRPLLAEGAKVEVWDPWIDVAEARQEYGLDLIGEPEAGAYEAIVLAVAHEQFTGLGPEAIRAFGKPKSVLFDVKSVLPKDACDLRL